MADVERRVIEGEILGKDWIATYLRYGTEGTCACDSLEGAVRFLRYGDEEGQHSSTSITGPDGDVAWSDSDDESIWELAERLGIPEY